MKEVRTPWGDVEQRGRVNFITVRGLDDKSNDKDTGLTNRSETEDNLDDYLSHSGYKKGRVVYTEGTVSRFDIEELIENYLGTYEVYLKTDNFKSIDALLEHEYIKSCKFLKSYNIGSDENTVEEEVYFNSEIVLRTKVATYHNGMKYIICFCRTDAIREKISKLIQEYVVWPDKVVNVGNINILIEENNSLKLKGMKTETEYIPSNYSKTINESRPEIIKLLGGSKGLFLFHSKPGAGKTNFIKSLPKEVTKKEFIFIPPSFGNILSSPSFLAFMIDHTNSVLIIEDGESLLRSRKGGENHAVSNILNLTDGILSELLNIQIICTLNCNVSQIDEALRRPGRLLWEQEFTELNVEESNQRLLELHGEECKTTKPLTIAEIYNYKTIEVEDKVQIGFKR